jgi:GntP family gluconate:H+ symporter
MAEALQVDLGLSIIIGILVGIGPASVTWIVANWLNRRLQVPLREVAGAPLADLKKIVDKPEQELPSFFWSITPILLPIALISLASFCEAAVKKPQTFSGVIALLGGLESFRLLTQWMAFIGNRNVALLIGTVVAIWVLMRQRGITVAQVCQMIGPPFETAGVIILITSAGGAFGLMLKNAGVGEAIRTSVDWGQVHPLMLVPASWAIASVIRIAQGSATVAMLTTSAMVYPIISTLPLPYHPIYIFIAIGFGAMILSWMNDSGFWVVGRLSGFTERETLKTWTVVTTVNSVVGLLECMLLSWVLPLTWLS